MHCRGWEEVDKKLITKVFIFVLEPELLPDAKGAVNFKDHFFPNHLPWLHLPQCQAGLQTPIWQPFHLNEVSHPEHTLKRTFDFLVRGPTKHAHFAPRRFAVTFVPSPQQHKTHSPSSFSDAISQQQSNSLKCLFNVGHLSVHGISLKCFVHFPRLTTRGQTKMRGLRETLRCLVILGCVSSLQCQVLKFVVAVSPRRLLPPPSPFVLIRFTPPPRCRTFEFSCGGSCKGSRHCTFAADYAPIHSPTESVYIYTLMSQRITRSLHRRCRAYLYQTLLLCP